MAKTYDEINKKIKDGKVVVVTAEEIIDIVKEKGLKETAKLVDVVTTATFGPMCSTGAFLNFGHATPAIRMEKTYLNKVEAYSGLAAVDSYIGASQESTTKGERYGGAHVICDLIDGKEIELEATSKGTDCYPRKEIKTKIKLKDLNEAYLFNPRNVYQNYSAAINTSNRTLYTYMGTLKENCQNITFSTSGELSPLINDPYYRTIGIGTRIFIAGAQGYVSWQGTQFNSSVKRDVNGIPLSPGGTLAIVGDLKEMSTEFIKPVVFKNYGVSMFVGIGIPIPILDEKMLKHVSIENKDIYTDIIDYSISDSEKPVIKKVSYLELGSGEVEINGKIIKAKRLTSLKKSREIAEKLKKQIKEGEFFIQKPIQLFSINEKVKLLKHD
jgi:uncharacterized protein (DUF39 family)